MISSKNHMITNQANLCKAFSPSTKYRIPCTVDSWEFIVSLYQFIQIYIWSLLIFFIWIFATHSLHQQNNVFHAPLTPENLFHPHFIPLNIFLSIFWPGDKLWNCASSCYFKALAEGPGALARWSPFVDEPQMNDLPMTMVEAT